MYFKVTEAADRNLPVLRQFKQLPSVDHRKLYDLSGHIQQPGGRRDSIPASPEP